METKTHAWTTSTLPSKGVYYKDAEGKPLVPDGVVQVRKLTVAEESILAGQGKDMAERISSIVANCSALPNKFDPQELLITDRMWLLLAQRVMTFGANYAFTYVCRHCRASNKADVNLVRDLDAVTPESIDLQRASEGKEPLTHDEPFEVRLPDANTTVRVRFMRGRDERAVIAASKKARMNKAMLDPSLPMSVAIRIVEVESIPDWAAWPSIKKELWVRALTALDNAHIRVETEKRETGVNTATVQTCGACGQSQEVEFGLDPEFFQPTSL